MKLTRSAKFSSYTSFKIVSGCLLVTLACNVYFTFKNRSYDQKSFKLTPTYPTLYHFKNITLPPEEFLIWNEFCRIPRAENFSRENLDSDLAFKASNCSEQIILNNFNKNYQLKFHKGKLVSAEFDEYETEDSTESEQKDFHTNIYLIGVQGLSQLDFQVKMPLIYDFFQKKGWFQLSGYNKINVNAFPNLMALLTGLNLLKIQEKCKALDNEEYLNKCHLLFKRLHAQDFFTAYVEDNVSEISFRNLPIDFYWAPMLRKNQHKDFNNKTGCNGSCITMDLIYKAATEFMSINMEKSKFGIFLINSISFTDSFDESPSFDECMFAYIRKWERTGVFEKNIFIFLSDHGKHWRRLPKQSQHYYEDRLPVLFIYLPAFIRQKYPEFAYALTVNKHRLTSPFDMYMTLQHLLSISQMARGLNEVEILPAESCPKCQTLLKPIAANRSCGEAGLSPAWCACETFYTLNTWNSEVMFNITRLVVQKINDFHAEHEPYQCRKLFLKSVDNVEIKANNILYDGGKLKELNFTALDSKNEGVWLLVNFTTMPGDMKYASPFLYFVHTHQIKLDIFDVSVGTSYEVWSNCVQNIFVKRFCYCF